MLGNNNKDSAKPSGIRSSMPYRLKLNGISATLLLVALLLVTASGRTQESGFAELLDSPDDIQEVDRVITVEDPPKDIQIQKRLTRILESSGAFPVLNVEVTQGLVTLKGEAREASDLEWAAKVAANIEGTVAVRNRLGVPQPDYLSWEPFRREALTAWNTTLRVAPLIIFGVGVFITFFLLSRPLSRLLTRPLGLLSESQLIRIVVRRLVALVIVILGLYFFLRIAGLSQIALAIVSGTGVLGLVVGFAFRDIAENFISSLLLSTHRPFRLGDDIIVDGHRGVVQKVTARGTTLVDYDGNHIQIPNATVYKGVIKNLTANPLRRGQFDVGIGYDSDIVSAQSLGMEIMMANPAVIDDPPPQILIDHLGSATVNLKVYFWVNAHQFAVGKVGSQLMRQFVQVYAAQGISMPDDAREVIFPQGVPVVPDTNRAPETPELHGNAAAVPETKPGSVPADRVASTDTEEDLSADVQVIQQQARESRAPDDGENII